MNFSKKDYEDSEEKTKKSGLFLTARHVSWLVSAIIVISFFVFVAGYFLGKKKAVEKFYSKIQQDSFADHIYYSMCSMYDKADDQSGQEKELISSPEVAVVEHDKCDTLIATSESLEEKTNNSTHEHEKNSIEVEKTEFLVAQEKNDCQYYAELIGFGTSRAAHKFADRLQKDNIMVSVKNRKSKTARGKIITWYQVVTQVFGDKNDLIALVDDISAQERLKDVRIVSC